VPNTRLMAMFDATAALPLMVCEPPKRRTLASCYGSIVLETGCTTSVAGSKVSSGRRDGHKIGRATGVRQSRKTFFMSEPLTYG
jgi:hypothetical protein